MIDFVPRDDIALRKADFDPARHKAFYRHNYEQIFEDIAKGILPDIPTYRQLILSDMFFILHFVMEIDKSNHPFVVKQCQVVQDGPKSDTLDIWARFHWKAIDVNEPILTPEGWSTHGALQIGDKVFAPDGTPTRVMAKTKVFRDAPCYLVKFDDRSEIVCSGQHLWTVEMESRCRVPGGREKWRTATLDTAQLKKEVDKKAVFKTKRYPRIPVAETIQFSHAELDIDPYVLGVWLGDGDSSGARITCGFEDAEEMEFLLRSTGIDVKRTKHSSSVSLQLGNGVRNKRGSSDFKNALRKYKLFKNKHIPQEYKLSSPTQRFSLLQGLMDTDGSCHHKHSQALFCNSNQKLANDVNELALSLGFKSTIRTSLFKYKGAPRTTYQVQLRATGERPPFRLTRKINACKPDTGRTLFRKIISVEPCNSIPVSCIQVDREDGMYLVGRNLVPTHNSTINTVSETLQYHLDDGQCPGTNFYGYNGIESCTGLLAYARPASRKFLRSIKILCEQNQLLKACFPDRLWDNPEYQSPKWSEEEGLVFKRKSSSRGESTIEAYGLLEGMPTGRHYERLVIDDIETEDMARSKKMLDDAYTKFDMAITNLGTGSDRDLRRINGTYYNHQGPMKKIGDMKFDDGKPMYNLRKVPATDNGKLDGNPVWIDSQAWERIKRSKHVNSQQLCNPTPEEDILIDSSLLLPIEQEFLPRNRFKFMVIDQAGDKEVNKTKGDMWAIGVISILPYQFDDIGQNDSKKLTDDDLGISDVYLEDLIADQMTHSEAIDTIVRMYLRNGLIWQLGVEKVSLSTTEIHIADALKAKGRKISVDHGNLVLLNPASRLLEDRITSALQWPLNNGHLYYSTSIQPVYRDRLFSEMDGFPFSHSDILNMWAYSYDMFKNFKFSRHKPLGKVVSVSSMMESNAGRSEFG